MDVPLSRKHAKAPESVAAQRFPALIVSSHAGGHWFESSSLHQKVPDFVRNQELFLFISSNSDAAFWRFSHDPNRDPKAERSGKHRRGADGIIRPSRTIFVGYMVWLMTLPMVSAAERFIPSVAWVSAHDGHRQFPGRLADNPRRPAGSTAPYSRASASGRTACCPGSGCSPAWCR